jgi:Protein of unknown function (DUF3168)
MTVEADIFTLLKGLVANRVYPDVAPSGVARPFIVYQQVGGVSLAFLDKTVPSKKNGRFQIAVWADTRSAVAALALQVESAFMTAPTMQASPLGSPVADVDVATNLCGSRQDFSVWSDR